MIYRFESYDFNINDKERSGESKIFKDADIQDENDMQTQEKLDCLNCWRQYFTVRDRVYEAAVRVRLCEEQQRYTKYL